MKHDLAGENAVTETRPPTAPVRYGLQSDSPGQTTWRRVHRLRAVPSSAHPVLKIYTAGSLSRPFWYRSGTDIISGLYHSDTILVSHLAVFICVSTKPLATQG